MEWKEVKANRENKKEYKIALFTKIVIQIMIMQALLFHLNEQGDFVFKEF